MDHEIKLNYCRFYMLGEIVELHRTIYFKDLLKRIMYILSRSRRGKTQRIFNKL